MRSAPFGRGGALVPALGQGTWDFGVRSIEGEPRDEERALQAGIELGLVHIDTAEMYGDGTAERIVGKAIARIPREKLFLVSKVLPSNATHAGTIAACERSMRRLGTDYLDAYLLHWRSPYPLEGTMGALERLVDDGKIRYLGVSNFDVEDLDEALGLLRSHPIACNQVLYHLGERGIERRLLPRCREAGVALVGYSPLGSGEFPPQRGVGESSLNAIAERRGVSTRAVALAFLTRDELAFAIPKSANAERLTANARGGDLVLTPAEIAEIDAAYPVPDRDEPLAVI